MQSRHSLSRGFTLVELVTTIILIGVLAVVAIPRLLSASSYSAYSLRNEFMAELRKAQLFAMNNTDLCIRVAVSRDQGYRIERYQGRTANQCSGAQDSAHEQPWQSFHGGSELALLAGGARSFNLDFDSLGRLPATGCSGDCILAVADETLVLAIESEGYIHAR
ncbi:pilus assembly FimT family protein [Shewanella litorisediminis]|uniref:Prepilin-type N-terminal cleavage/methylation domain-containing protein n=1 Tax=Shewanella litorisediminis TaxID=1173586 RepID=A0ABX7G4H5_9GAMM|nr:type II secretion system protein [Shewanella litorisediminis]MCL2917820.1 prepilin-type N-terminal cleavage/methylation domain-containing protein [Shewanella litorisediminis]QRH02261.1 prepilin-type N-terminal cleavage/methylation domain-containing protein [Shewanella litorisediminis]